MGYLSDHRIVPGAYIDKDKFKEVFEELVGYSEAYWWGDAFLVNGAKWYDFPEDIEAISKKFPTVEFLVTRYGEDYDDNERFKIKNGNITTRYRREWVEN